MDGNKLLRDGILALMFSAMGGVVGRSVHANTAEKAEKQLRYSCSQETACVQEKLAERDSSYITLGSLFGLLAAGATIALVHGYERRLKRETYDPHLRR